MQTPTLRNYSQIIFQCGHQPSCRRLWCTTSEGEESGCRTQHMPWADGTTCGRDESNKVTHWCIKSECILKEGVDIVKAADGHWSEWQR